jgi:large subunit ribosomal protein L22e
MIQGEGKQIKKKEKSYKKYYVDFNAAVTNNLLSLEAAIKFLNSNIKVNGLKNKLGESVKVSASSAKDKQKNTILVQADTKIKFSKRYIKYLVKKFLKRENISLYLRVISQGAANYVVKLFNRNSE